MKSILAMAAVAGFALGAAPALANGFSVEQALDAQAAPSARQLQASVDSYLASSRSDASLVGGAGSAGYDGGFWIRGGTFLLKLNLTIQTRWEGFQWDTNADEPSPGGDLSGFSLPRVTLKLSGDATCDVHYYAELEFGHAGSYLDNQNNIGITPPKSSLGAAILDQFILGPNGRTAAFRPDLGIAREAWIEYEAAPQLAFRMGLVKTAATRQLMTPPELQQFVDISMASAFIGAFNPGYSDRNRDYGFMVHGAVGCDGEWQYLVTVTNGDGPVRRNVLDGTTDDPMAYSARINWDVKGHMGYEEGALRQHSCEWVAAIGVWGTYFLDHFRENALTDSTERATYGVDVAAGYGGFSFTGAYSMADFKTKFGTGGVDFSAYSYLIQLGYLFPDTAWELAARYSRHNLENKPATPTNTFGGSEIGAAVNYYIDGHADKVTLDVSFISAEESGNYVADTYAGYSSTAAGDATMLRLQWQLAL